MNIWLAISLFLVIVTIYMLAIEIFSVAFKLTGMATEKIKFQVASLFTGTGYTTAESELIAKDEKRRKIARACIYSGHIFSVAFMGLVINVVISLSMTMAKVYDHPHFTEWYFIVLYITAFFFLLVLFLKIPPINRRFQKLLENIAIKTSKKNKKTNLINVFDLHGKHAIAEVILNIVPEYANETPLSEMGLTKKFSINVLSIRRDNRIIEVSKDTMFRKGDVLVVYGLLNDIKEAFLNSINKESITAKLDHVNEITLINNYGSIAVVEVFVEVVPKLLDNITLEDAQLKARFDISVGFIERKNNYIAVDKDTIIQKGDTVTLFGPYNSIKTLFNNEESITE